ncbi:MAG: diphosphomevalonate decarboxylase [Propioniciclava sp.]|uniref:diphosphomevalonate decarboxylase n=1 Tax=Propioniciclava sp. TaxID=2038686 RepID=UPI0039E62FD6
MRRPGAATATAHANIALIKYWGKADHALILPRTSSLSLTLDELYTTTTVRFLDAPGDDRVTLDGEPVTGRPLQRITALLDLVRERAGLRAPAEVTSLNTVPTAAGLASSASGFAALAGAAAAASGLDLSPRELSRLARRGSGSASRSIFGGLAIWHAGTDDASSYAEPVHDGAEGGGFADELALVVLVLDAGRKTVSSREAMRLSVETSPAYEPWVAGHAGQLAEALDAIAHRDLARLGEVAEANALGMHATMRAATPSVDYLTEASHAALRAVADARASGFPAWATMDAGPNVKVLTSADRADALERWLRQRLEPSVPQLRTIVTHAGPGLQVTR